jgi:hypothetical protein
LGGGNFQDTSKTINIIFGGDSIFPSKRAQKLMLREIMTIELVVPRPLHWLEVHIHSLGMISGLVSLSRESSCVLDQ